MNKKVIVWIAIIILIGLGWWTYDQGYIFTSQEDKELKGEVRELDQDISKLGDIIDEGIGDIGEEIPELPE